MINSQRINSIKGMQQSASSAQKGYFSNPPIYQSTGVNHFAYVYPVEKKQDMSETINSEQSDPSVKSRNSLRHKFQQVQISIQNPLRESIVQKELNINAPEQRLESQNQSLSLPLQEKHLQIEIQQEQFEEEQQQMNGQNYDQQTRNKPFQPTLMVASQQKMVDRSFEAISAFTTNSSKKYGSSRISKNAFYYDRIGNQTSEILPPGIDNYYQLIFQQSLLPLLIAFLVFVLNYVIQRGVDQYCFIENVCKCSGFGAKLWSWFRQLIMFKLALIIYRKFIIGRLAMGSNNLRHKEPLMEYFLLFAICILIDLFLIMFIDTNQDLVFLGIVYLVGIVVLLNTFRIRDWLMALRKGNGILFYDICLLALILFIYYAIPDMLGSLGERLGRTSGRQTFFYIYPLIDLCMEIFLDTILTICQFAELYIYQIQLLIIGVRVGILCLVGVTTFEFWYIALALGLLRANNSSMFLTVFLRRWLYYQLPQKFQFITKMSETKKSLKGKHGAYIEHQFWIIFFYFFYITKTSVPHIAKDVVYITDCHFNNNQWDQIEYTYQPFIIWVLLMSGTLLGVVLNQQSQYDNIKYFGGTQFNLFENILIKIAGYYYFQLGLMVPFVVRQLNDLNKLNTHSLISTTTQT